MNSSTFISPKSYQAPGGIPRRLLGGVVLVVVLVALVVYWVASGKRQAPQSLDGRDQSTEARGVGAQPRGSSHSVDEAAERAVAASRRNAASANAASANAASTITPGLADRAPAAAAVAYGALPGLRLPRERAAGTAEAWPAPIGSPADAPAVGQDSGAPAREMDARSTESRIFDEPARRAVPEDPSSLNHGSDRPYWPGSVAAIGASALEAMHPSAPPPADSAMMPPFVDDALRHLAPPANRNLAQREDEWQDRAAQVASAASPLVARPAAGPLVVEEGTVIPAVLTRRIDSDTPGVITAMVSIDVYDTRTARSLLLPKGSRLVGRYNNDVSTGQERLQVAFTRLILPDGSSFDLPGAGGSDALGQSGLPADIDRHFVQRFGAALLIGVIADHVVSAQAVPPANAYGGGLSATGQVLVNTADAELHRNESIEPTLTIPEGTRLNVEVVRDMIFSQPVAPRS